MLQMKNREEISTTVYWLLIFQKKKLKKITPLEKYKHKDWKLWSLNLTE